jgi:predicted permease
MGKNADDMPPGKLALAIAKSIFTHPFILSAVAGGIVAGLSIPVPTPLTALLGFLTNAAGPCALFALGVTLSRRKIEGVGAELPIIVFLKIIVHPLLVLVILSVIGETDPVWVAVAVLMASLPTATNVFIMGRQYDAYVQGASSAILITSSLGAITLSLLLYLVDRQWLPLNITDLLALFGLT